MVANDEELNAAAAAKPHPKVTVADLEAKVKDVKYVTTGVLTMAVVTVENGFTLLGKSACADPRNFDEELGKQIALKDAINQLWPLEGYLLRQRIHEGAV